CSPTPRSGRRLFAPPSAARLKTPTWSPAVVDVDFALIATPEETVTETEVVTATGAVMDRSSFSIHFFQSRRFNPPASAGSQALPGLASPGRQNSQRQNARCRSAARQGHRSLQ